MACIVHCVIIKIIIVIVLSFFFSFSFPEQGTLVMRMIKEKKILITHEGRVSRNDPFQLYTQSNIVNAINVFCWHEDMYTLDEPVLLYHKSAIIWNYGNVLKV